MQYWKIVSLWMCLQSVLVQSSGLLISDSEGLTHIFVQEEIQDEANKKA